MQQVAVAERSAHPNASLPQPNQNVTLSKEELRNQLLASVIAKARIHLLTFIKLIYPTFEVGPHHEDLCHQLERLERGEIRRLMVFMPPRSSKSLIVSQIYPAWCMGRHPLWHTMCISYSDDLATEFGREVRNFVNGETYKTIFPGVDLRPDSRSANRFRTLPGGVYNSFGITSSIAGHGFHLGIIDDPLSEQTAFSKIEREKINAWYYPSFLQRQMPDSRVIIMHTRWHLNDLAGYLLEDERQRLANNEKITEAYRWHVLKIPGIINEGKSDEHSYWPGWWSLDQLKRTRDPMPAYKWLSTYQQEPVAEGGGILKKSWWNLWSRPKPPLCNYILMSCDTAYSSSERADFSAITVWGVFTDEHLTEGEPCIILLDAQRGRWEYPELKDTILSLAKHHNPDGIIIEMKSSGQSLAQDMRLSNIPVIEYKPTRATGDKETRVHSITGMFSAGRIWAPEGKPWADDVVTECSAFPGGVTDDYLDTVVMATLWLKSGRFVSNDSNPIDDDTDAFTIKRYYT